jgi:hypothetical protein
MKTWIHPDMLRLPNFGGVREFEERWFARIESESKEVEELRARGFSIHDAWMLVRMQRGLVN